MRAAAVGGARIIERNATADAGVRYTPRPALSGPKLDRTDVRRQIAPAVERLTESLLAPSAGDAESRDPYIRNLRKDIGKHRRNPVGMALAIAADDIARGKSLADVTAWAHEFIAECKVMVAERDGQKIAPPDLTPLRRKAQRAESAADVLEIGLDEDCPVSVAEYRDKVAAEVAADAELVQVATERLVVLRGGR